MYTIIRGFYTTDLKTSSFVDELFILHKNYVPGNSANYYTPTAEHKKNNTFSGKSCFEMYSPVKDPGISRPSFANQNLRFFESTGLNRSAADIMGKTERSTHQRSLFADTLYLYIKANKNAFKMDRTEKSE